MDLTTETTTLSSSTQEPPIITYNNLIVVLVIGIFGVVGNGIVIVVLVRKEYRKKVSNLLLINQSIIDWLTNFFLVTSTWSKAFPKSYSSLAGILVCYIFDNESMMQFMYFLSTNNIVLITMERYLMVVAPVFHRNRATKKSSLAVIAVTTLVHLFINLPLSLPYTLIINGRCYERGRMSMHSLDAILISYSIVYLYGPIALFLITYPHMFFCLRKQTSIRPSVSTASTENKPKVLSKHELNLILVSVTITTSFVLCNAPTYLGYTLIRAGVVSPAYVGGLLWKVCLTLTYINQVINPILYAFSYNDFKKGFYKTFKIKLGRKLPSEESSITAATN